MKNLKTEFLRRMTVQEYIKMRLEQIEAHFQRTGCSKTKEMHLTNLSETFGKEMKKAV